MELHLSSAPSRTIRSTSLSRIETTLSSGLSMKRKSHLDSILIPSKDSWTNSSAMIHQSALLSLPFVKMNGSEVISQWDNNSRTTCKSDMIRSPKMMTLKRKSPKSENKCSKMKVFFYLVQSCKKKTVLKALDQVVANHWNCSANVPNNMPTLKSNHFP